MNWIPAGSVAALAVILVLMKKSGEISAADALAHLRGGALVIDVRSPGEFSAGHLPDAINLPLPDIKTALPALVPDKCRVLLLHCQSGLRSGVARRELNGLGYTNSFNLGSYGRAERILKQR